MAMTSIDARVKGEPRDLAGYTDKKYPALDPGNNAALTRLGREIADSHGIAEGQLRLRVYGGPRVRDIFV